VDDAVLIVHVKLVDSAVHENLEQVSSPGSVAGIQDCQHLKGTFSRKKFVRLSLLTNV
jgi:hypothetical protein